MIVALLITKYYAYMMRENKMVIKLPGSVPPMVSDSLSPTFVAMIVFIIAFVIKAGFAYTPFGDAMNFVNTIITAPITAVGSSPLSVVIIFTFANFLWFFGIHPAAIINLFYAITAPIFIYNINAFLAGESQPYLEFMFMTGIIMIGGTGNTIGLAINMLRAKSEKFKALRKLVVIPSIFNINEPLIFGMPIVLNPILIVPFILSPLISMGIGALLISSGIVLPGTLDVGWTTPQPIKAFLSAGGSLGTALSVIIVFIICVLIYLPFVNMANKQTLEKEENK